ncbi:MAG: VWA domain-containing protein [Bacteroidales bacterium]|nr:VWA domain-containing protein [Bacteroidales bacterium]
MTLLKNNGKVYSNLQIRMVKAMKKLFLAAYFVIIGVNLFAAGGAQEGSGSNRGAFLSRGGYIIPSQDVKIDNYIAQYDYDYPLPQQGALNVVTGIGIKDDNAYIQIGLKGKKTPFEELPPLNICFCIDRSGSMTPVMPWVKDSFYIFIDRVREGDIISLVDMDTNAHTLIAPTQINSQEDRTRFKREVDKITANGGTNVYAGMVQSYKELEKTYNQRYINRVVILTDGMHNFGDKVNKDILDLAADYNKRGINISTVMLGINAATGLMVDVAIDGGGSSRFISDHDEMVKIFQTELDRMLVPAARDLNIRLILGDGIIFKNTWGYRHYVEGNTVNYHLPTLHNGDYETMLAEVSFNSSTRPNNAGVVYLDYLELDGTAKTLGPYTLQLDTSMADGGYINDRRVREAEGLLYFSRGLIDIANKTAKISTLERELYQYANPSPQRDDVVQQVLVELHQNLGIIESLTDYLSNISGSLGDKKYEKELEILQNYKQTFTNVYNAYTNNVE